MTISASSSRALQRLRGGFPEDVGASGSSLSCKQPSLPKSPQISPSFPKSQRFQLFLFRLTTERRRGRLGPRFALLRPGSERL